MGTQLALVSCPASPFCVDSLFPDADWALLAGQLQAAGVDARVFDYGTPASLERLYPPELRERAARLLNGENGGTGRDWMSRMGGSSRVLGQRLQVLAADVARDLAAQGPPRVVCLRMSAQEGALMCRYIARAVKRSAPGAVALLDASNAAAVRPGAHDEVFDGVLGGDAHAALLAVCRHPANPDRWPASVRLPGAGGAAETHKPASLVLSSGECYEAALYPAAERGTKFNVFTIGTLRRPGNPWQSAGRVLRNVETLHQAHGVRAFCFGAGAVNPEAINSLAVILRDWGLPLSTAWRLRPEHMTAGALLRLAQSGAVALGWSVPTGSQRLAEDVYGRTYSVSAAEKLLRRARDLDMLSSVHLRFPHAADDAHTRAESMRLVRRSGALGAVIHSAITQEGGSPPPIRPLAAETLWRRYRILSGEGWQGQWSAAVRRLFDPHHPGDAAHLLAEISREGHAPYMCERLMLTAHLAGFRDSPRDFLRGLWRALLTGSTDDLTALVEQVNKRARGPIAMAAPSIAALRTAVGN